uniref:Non-specific serine/threonine protein kinase n=1 Tax=Rhabditophanes sp. KR3021 TaxID=114890 RepID=A0AC35UD24_9BILA
MRVENHKRSTDGDLKELQSEPFKQGAEAKLYRCVYEGVKAVVKVRFPKTYRHSDLDKKLTEERRRAEAKGHEKCMTNGIPVPKLLAVFKPDNALVFEHIEGEMTLKTHIEELRTTLDGEAFKVETLKLAGKLGTILSKMHALSIIHGDLTTSNILMRGQDEMLLIDFGLTFMDQHSAEHKATDLYVLERAIRSTHHQFDYFFEQILDAYKEAGNSEKVIQRLDAIRLRGRKRDMTG